MKPANYHERLRELNDGSNDAEAEVHAVQRQISEVLPGNSGWLDQTGKIGEVALRVRQLQNWANKIAGFRDEWKKEERANHRAGRDHEGDRHAVAPHSRRCDRTRWENLMTKELKFWIHQILEETRWNRKEGDICTQLNEPTMEKLISVRPGRKRRKRHRNYMIAERIKIVGETRSWARHTATAGNTCISGSDRTIRHQGLVCDNRSSAARRADGCIKEKNDELPTPRDSPIHPRWVKRGNRFSPDGLFPKGGGAAILYIYIYIQIHIHVTRTHTNTNTCTFTCACTCVSLFFFCCVVPLVVEGVV